MKTSLLDQKVIVIVGGAGLLGIAFSFELIKHGAILIIADADVESARCLCSKLNNINTNISSNAFEFETDFTSKKSIDDLIEKITEKFGKIDAVVNNAYPKNKNYGRKLELVEYSDFCENINLHLGGYFLSSQRFSEYFKKQGYGHVINISSIYGSMAPRFEIYENTNMTMPVEYSAIKAAIQNLSIYFMRYYKGSNIRFNCISPGGILDNQPEYFLSNYKKYSQSKGMLNPSDIAGTLVFLLSDLSTYVNGQNIIVDDGWST